MRSTEGTKGMRKFCFLLLLAIFVIPINALAKLSPQPVNILTWWGYLDQTPNEIQKIEKKCNAHISYDTYYSNDEFLDRFKKHDARYDVIIFSQTILNSVKNKIALPNSKLYLQANGYENTIRKEYFSEKLPHNIVYFVLSMTGFLYNPSVIDITPSESIDTIFKKAGNNIIVMIDDPVEANFLIGLMQKNNQESASAPSVKNISLTWKNFKKLFQKTRVIITNSPEKIINLPNFAFAFQWSGDSISIMGGAHKNLKFLIHPKLSYISLDLLAELNTRQPTICVAHALSSPEFLNSLQEKSFYFSPYFPKPSDNVDFQNLYDQVSKQLPILSWLASPNDQDLNKLKKNWDYIRFKSSEVASSNSP